MKLKTFIQKLQKMEEDFKTKFDKDPMIFDLSNDSFDNKLEITLTSKMMRDGCLSSTDPKATKEYKIKY